MSCGERVWDNGDMIDCGRPTPCPLHPPRVPYVLVGMDVMKRHFLAAIPEAQRLLKEAEQGKIKPYENCIAFALALKEVCLQFGWKPQDFLDLIAPVGRPPNG